MTFTTNMLNTVIDIVFVITTVPSVTAHNHTCAMKAGMYMAAAYLHSKPLRIWPWMYRLPSGHQGCPAVSRGLVLEERGQPRLGVGLREAQVRRALFWLSVLRSGARCSQHARRLTD